MAIFMLAAAAVLALPAAAHAATETVALVPSLGPRKIFLLLFLMLGPIKVLVPFVEMTRGTEAAFRRQLATRALLVSAAALTLAGALGRNILETFEIPVPVLALTGGLVLFLVALDTVMQQFSRPQPPNAAARRPDLGLAVMPLAFPTIVTPYGLAAIIIFIALAKDDVALKLTVASVTLFILLLDWLTMLFAHVILKWLGPVLQIIAVVIGVTQIALGLQVILRSLVLIGVFAEHAS